MGVKISFISCKICFNVTYLQEMNDFCYSRKEEGGKRKVERAYLACRSEGLTPNSSLKHLVK